jgi:hypothetical protein
MKPSLRPFGVFAAILFSLCACYSSYPSEAVSAAASSTQPEPKSAGLGAPVSQPVESVFIPGPLRSFLRMAGISQQISPGEVLPLLAQNVYQRGYESNNPTEFLVLLRRYLRQARELQTLAGTSSTIRVSNCDDAGTLIHILGYRLRQSCGQAGVVLETANPERAFLTIDSGFPITDLEEALQKGTPFTYSYPDSRVPVLLKEHDWIGLNPAERRGSGNIVDALVNDPAVARLYWALSQDDAETQLALQQSPGLRRLLPFAPVMDFYGSQICIRDGRVLVPGEARAEPDWKDLVGARPDSPGDFVIRLLAKDNGWLAAYFDTLSRLSRTQQEHFTEASRLKRFYEEFRRPDLTSNAAKGVFRNAPQLLVLLTRLEWQTTGEPRIPGNLEVWKEVFRQKTGSGPLRNWSRHARNWDHPEQLLDAMIAYSRIDAENGPLQIYLMLSELDSERYPDHRLSPETVYLLADKFSEFSNWYLIFSEFPELSDASITQFLHVADAIDGISNRTLRGNVLGAFQANIGLWQILARQGEIPNPDLNTSWLKVIEPFAKISSSIQLFDAAHNSLGELLLVATGKSNCSQGEIIDVLAGPRQESMDGQRVRLELAGRIRSVLDDQQLVSLDTLFALSDGLNEMAQGKAATPEMLSLAGELREFEMPRPIFTSSEKISWAPAIYSSRHAELQVRTDLTKVIKSPSSPARLEAARGQLAPYLRDTLVGLNYAYYEPPGAQVLHNNPLFVRSHDFTGISMLGAERLWQNPMLLAVGMPAGGGAYLMGSLADLSYALATAEQDFIAPENVQALIWKEFVPSLLVSATVPRWWSVSPNELHAVALYQQSGEELLTASMGDAQLQSKVISILSDRMEPQRLQRTEEALRAKDPAEIVPRMMPTDTLYLAAEFRRRFSGEAASWGPAGQQLENLSRLHPAEVSLERLSRDFGVPHPTLARNYTPNLLNVRPFPFFGGYSSRLFSESWESSNLYWARLADEKGYSPVMLNGLVPELTRHMTAKIFATSIEDWPAILRAMQATGEEFREGKITSLSAANAIVPGGGGR